MKRDAVRKALAFSGLFVALIVLVALIASASTRRGDLPPLPTQAAVFDSDFSTKQPSVSIASFNVLTSPTVVPSTVTPSSTVMPQPSAPPSPETVAVPTAVPAIPTHLAMSTPRPTVEPVVITVPQQPVPNQLVIRFNPTASEQERQAYIASIGGTVTQNIAALNAVVVAVPDASAVEIAPSDVVAQSEPDYFVSALIDVPPSDPYYNQQWALPVIGAPEAWLEMPADAPKVTVAVIDSGICAEHPDLAGRILPGWDFVENDAEPQDVFGHGCGVAGIIAANTDNRMGIAGVAPNAMILPLRVLDANGIGTYSNVAAAIVRATDAGAKVINLSLGGAHPSTVLQQAIDYAVARDVWVIAAAGNTSGSVLWPAAYAPVIAVGSVDQNLERSSFSSYGPEIDLWAPGRDVLVTANGAGFRAMSGTSFAAPHVSGVAVLNTAFGRSLALHKGLLHTRVQVTASLTPTASTTMQFPTPAITITPNTGTVDIPTISRVILASEIEYGPSTDPFTTDTYLQSVGSVLASEDIMHAATSIDLAATTFGVNPRIILALIESRTGLVLSTTYDRNAISNPLGLSSDMPMGFEAQISWVAEMLRTELLLRENSPNYEIVRFADGTSTRIGYEISSGDFVLLSVVARIGAPSGWKDRYDAFIDAYERLLSANESFGVSAQVTFPTTMKLPFEGIQRYTGGPHAGAGNACASVALDASGIDFAAKTPGKSFAVLNIADGILKNVAYIGDQNPQTIDWGWTVSVELDDSNGLVVLYSHLDLSNADVSRLQDLKGKRIPQGYVIGNAGRSGGQSSIHLHLELRTGGTSYNSYSSIGSRVGWDNVVIDGWTIHIHRIGQNGSTGYNYQGSAVRGSSKQVLLDAYCGDGKTSWATVGNNYNREDETNRIDENTVFANIDSSSEIASSNTPSQSPSCQGYSYNGVVLFRDANCGGDKREFNSAGFRNLTDHSFNDIARSIHVASNWSVRIWEHSDRGGATRCITGSMWDLNSDNYDNGLRIYNTSNNPPGTISSIEVFDNPNCSPAPSCSPSADQVALFVDPDFRGACTVKGIGDYLNPGAMGIANDAVSSLRVGGNVQVLLCQDDDYRGTCEVFTGDDNTLVGNAVGDNSASSMRVVPRSVNINTWVGTYFEGTQRWSDTNNGSNQRCVDTSLGNFLNRDFGSNAPCSGMSSDNWVGDYVARIDFSSANWYFALEHDDGARIWIDGVNWADYGSSGNDYVGCPNGISLTGTHTVRVMLREDSGSARIQLTPSTSNSGCGGALGNWTARFYDGQNRWWDPTNAGNQLCGGNTINYPGPQLAVSYGAAAPCSGADGDTWVGDYTAAINFPTGNYAFRVDHDDWLKFWINGQNVSERSSGGTTWLCPARPLSGNVNLRAILWENTGDARINITWTTDNVCADVPANLTATTVSQTELQLSWGDSSNETSYSLERSDNGTSWSQIATPAANQTSYRDSGLLCGRTYYYRVRAVRPENGQSSDWSNIASAATRSCEDTTPPTGVMTAPAYGSYQNGTTIRLAAEASDAESGINRVEFRAWATASWSNQQWILLNADTTPPYEYDWNIAAIPDGDVWVTAWLYDNRGNERKLSGASLIPVIIDRTPPDAAIVGPSQYFNANQILIEATAADATSDVLQVDFYVGYDPDYIGGQQVDASGLSANDRATPLPMVDLHAADVSGQVWNWRWLGTDADGSNGWSFPWDASTVPDQPIAFFIYAYDRAGNYTGVASWDHGLDRTKPTGRISAPARDAHHAGPAVTLRAEVNDSLSGVSGVRFFAWSVAPWSNQNWVWLNTDTVAPYEYSWDVSALSEASIFISAYVYDRAGNAHFIWEPDWTVFVLDRTAPTSSVNPLPATIVGNSVIVRWGGSDNFTGSSQLVYDIEYQTNCVGVWRRLASGVLSTETVFTGNYDNSYCFRSRASDLAGNVEAWPTTPDAMTFFVRPTNTPTATPTATSTPTATRTPTNTPTPTFTPAGTLSPSMAAPLRNYYTTNTLTLRWGRVSSAAGYEVQVATSATFLPTSIVYTYTGSALETTISPALTDGYYYWRVRAQLSNGAWGPWSITDSFVVDVP